MGEIHLAYCGADFQRAKLNKGDICSERVVITGAILEGIENETRELLRRKCDKSFRFSQPTTLFKLIKCCVFAIGAGNVENAK